MAKQSRKSQQRTKKARSKAFVQRLESKITFTRRKLPLVTGPSCPECAELRKPCSMSVFPIPPDFERGASSDQASLQDLLTDTEDQLFGCVQELDFDFGSSRSKLKVSSNQASDRTLPTGPPDRGRAQWCSA